MENCPGAEENRLKKTNRSATRPRSCADALFRRLGSDGMAMGAYENALNTRRSGCSSESRSARFQLVPGPPLQDACQYYCRAVPAVRLAHGAEGKMTDSHAALSKAFCTPSARDGGLGPGAIGRKRIVADYNVARFFTDAEALYTYEGRSFQMQNLFSARPLRPQCLRVAI